MANESTDLAVVQKPTNREIKTVENDQPLFDTAKLEHYQRIATGLMYSSMLPPSVQGPDNLPLEQRAKVTFSNLILLLDIADRWKSSIIAVTQTASIVHGKICFEGKMIQAVLEQRLGIELTPEYYGEEGTDSYGIKFTDPRGRKIKGTVADWQTFDRSGKPLKQWVGNQQEAQLHYRGTREWVRRFEPGLLLGIYSDDELLDIKSDRREAAQAAQTSAAPISGGFTKPKPEADTQASDTDDALSQINEALAKEEAEERAKLEAETENNDRLTPSEVMRRVSEADNSPDAARALFAKCDPAELAKWRHFEIQNGRSVPEMTAAETTELMQIRRAKQGATAEGDKVAAKKAEKAITEMRKSQDPKASQGQQSDESNGIKCLFCRKLCIGSQIDAGHVDDNGDFACQACAAAEFKAQRAEKAEGSIPADTEIPDDDDENEESDSTSEHFERGLSDSRKGKAAKPGKVSQEENLKYAMGYNQGLAERVDPDANEEDAEEVLDDPIPQTDPAPENLFELGFKDGYDGKNRTPPRGLVAVGIEKYVKGHAAGLAKLASDEEAKDLASRDPFNIFAETLVNAPSWAGIKNGLIILNKTTAWAEDSKIPGSPKIREARRSAWARADELESSGGEFVDMTLDLTAFRCFVEFETDPERISTFWETLVDGQLYQALSPDRQNGLATAIRDRVRDLTS